MREGHGARGEDLQVPKQPLGLEVEDLGLGPQLGDAVVGLDVIVDLVGRAVRHRARDDVVGEQVTDARGAEVVPRGRDLLREGRGRLEVGGVDVGDGLRAELGLGGLALGAGLAGVGGAQLGGAGLDLGGAGVHLLLLRQDLGLEVEEREQAEGQRGDAADDRADPDRLALEAVGEFVRLELELVLQVGLDDEHRDREEDEEGAGREHVDRALERLGRAEHKQAEQAEGDDHEEAGNYGADDPRQEDRGQTADEGELHADGGADGRVRRRDGQVGMAREVVPEGRGDHDGEEAVHEQVRGVLEDVGIGDATLDGVCDGGPEQDRATELAERGDDDGLRHRQGFRPDGGREGVGDIVGSDAEGAGEGEDAREGEDPGVGAAGEVGGGGGGVLREEQGRRRGEEEK